MPYYDASNHIQTEIFIETLSLLQAIVDKYSSICPVKIFGDFNVQLPKYEPPNKWWYRERGYSKHSLIFYEFMIENNLDAANRLFPQGINHTFFCHKRGVYSWVDHILCFKHDFNSISECGISQPSADNNSDHLPVHIVFPFDSPEPLSAGSSSRLAPSCTPITWSNEFKARYHNVLQQKLLCLEPMQIGYWGNREQAQAGIDSFMSRLCQMISESAVESSGRQGRKQFQPKPYWCPRLSELRERKRFWWHIWRDCDRPREGVVYESYKSSKKQFRQASRQRVDDLSRGKINKFNELFYSGKLTSFWRYVRRKRRCNVNSNLLPDDLAKFYEGVMTDRTDLNEEQRRIAEQVDTWRREHTHARPTEAAAHITPHQVSKFIDRLNNGCAPGLDGITTEHLKYGKSDALCSAVAHLLSVLVKWQTVPSSFMTGLIVPILKKPGLNTNDPANFRPVTLSSVFSKLLEMLLLPDDSVHCTQFGFRKARGTAQACSLFNDIKCCFTHKKSPL